MFKKILKLLFSPAGRINRAKWWQGALLILGVHVLMGILVALVLPKFVAEDKELPYSSMVMLIVVLAIAVTLSTIYSKFALGIKRLHDHGKSGWWILLSFVPLVNIVIFIYLGFFRGTVDPNKFGHDPLAAETEPQPSQE